MTNYRDRSKELLVKELSRKIHDLYVSVLDRAEKHLAPNKYGESWKMFRYEVLNLGNTCIRETSALLSNYFTEFRPPLCGVTYNYEGANTSKIAQFTFDFANNVPFMRIQAIKTQENAKTLESIKNALNCGSLSEVDGAFIYEVKGLYAVFNNVIPFFVSNNALKGATLEKFNVWKEKVYSLEESASEVERTR